MSESRVNVIGEDRFDPRKWLRREVLWASLMTPYSTQLAGWLNESVTQKSQHYGNVTRQRLYQVEGDTELLSLSFFNQGKNVGGLISSIALFKACMDKQGEGASVNLLEVQAFSVDKVLEKARVHISSSPLTEELVYDECAAIVKSVDAMPDGKFGRNHQLTRAGRLMAGLAVQEAHTWIEASKQDDNQSLPVLTINNGGHPRSTGDRVNMLQPIFHDIIRSEKYASL